MFVYLGQDPDVVVGANIDNFQRNRFAGGGWKWVT